MAIQYKIDIMKALKDAGYSTYKLQKENILGNSTMQKIKTGEVVSAANLSKLCQLLHCQPADLLEYIEE